MQVRVCPHLLLNCHNVFNLQLIISKLCVSNHNVRNSDIDKDDYFPIHNSKLTVCLASGE
jgi:hypothetical protein